MEGLIKFSREEIEALLQLLYGKIVELDLDPETKKENTRKHNRANILDAIYKRISALQ